jgi:hypothetical protein
MANPAGESESGSIRLDFDRRLMVQFRGSVVTSDAGLLAYRELDDALGLTAMASETLADARTGKNGRHALAGLFRQSVFGRLAGYEDVNDAERLRHDPAMRWIVGGKAAQGHAASPSQMGRFETQWLAAPANLSALSDLSGQWIDIVHGHRPPKGIVLDMDSSVSPTHGEQEMSVWNGHYQCTCYHPLFVFNQFGDLERCVLRPGNVHSADGWEGVLKPVIVRYQGKVLRIYFRATYLLKRPVGRQRLDAVVMPDVRGQRRAVAPVPLGTGNWSGAADPQHLTAPPAFAAKVPVGQKIVGCISTTPVPRFEEMRGANRRQGIDRRAGRILAPAGLLKNAACRPSKAAKVRAWTANLGACARHGPQQPRKKVRAESNTKSATLRRRTLHPCRAHADR